MHETKAPAELPSEIKLLIGKTLGCLDALIRDSSLPADAKAHFRQLRKEWLRVYPALDEETFDA